MQAGDNEILNQEEVDAAGNKDDLGVELLGVKKKLFKDLGMREEGVEEPDTF